MRCFALLVGFHICSGFFITYAGDDFLYALLHFVGWVQFAHVTLFWVLFSCRAFTNAFNPFVEALVESG